MSTPNAARGWHTLSAAVVIAGLILQFALVLDGASVLVSEDPPALGTRVFRFFCYFTIQSNLLIALGTTWLARRPRADGTVFRAVRAAGLVGITITAVVHFVALRPLLDLHGASATADVTLHQVVPVLAVVGWVAFGPRPRVDASSVGAVLGWAIAWLALTFAVDLATGWVPYPFLDHAEHGWGGIGVACGGVLVLALALLGALRWLDQRLAPR